MVVPKSTKEIQLSSPIVMPPNSPNSFHVFNPYAMTGIDSHVKGNIKFLKAHSKCSYRHHNGIIQVQAQF